MDVIEKQEHLNCFHYEGEGKPTVEIRQLAKGDEEVITFHKNVIVFMTEGSVRFIFREHPEKCLSAGEFIFFPVGGVCRYAALEKSRVTVVRPNGIMSLCTGFRIEGLYRKEDTTAGKNGGGVHALAINSPLQQFLSGLNYSVRDGINCREYFNTKVQEMFILILAYYPREQLRELFSSILTPDTVFSEFVRANHHKYRSAKEMAQAMNITPNVFSKKFKKTFGEPSADWLRKEKAQVVYSELCSGGKSMKQIANTYKFSSQSHLNQFCKSEFGKNPGEIRNEGLKM